MKILKTGFFVVLVLLISVSICAAEKGPIPDKVYFDVRMQEDIGIRDTAEGQSDIFYYGIDGSLFNGLDDKTLSKLDVYSVPSGSWSLSLNPYPNEEPYYFEKDEETIFNPFAIRDLRFALNFLINRQYIVDEIMDGAGGPMYSMATPGQPGTYRYNLVANKFGFTPEGDEEKALADIDNAMQKAAELPENQGRLKKEDDMWTFDGEPVTIKFYIRVDDPNGRMKVGEYLTQQLEKAGIGVEQLLWDRSKAWGVVYSGNPEDWEYSLYTEGWGAGATRRYWEHIVAQMYAPWYGYMPGGFGDGWKYKHEKLDEMTQNAYNGNFLTEEEYWDLALGGMEIGLKEAVRVYIGYQEQYFVANKSSFEERFAYGLGDGLCKHTLVTADTEDGIVRATQFSSKGNLFMSAWNPVGPDGFSDTYSNYIVNPLYDQPAFESPSTAYYEFNRAVPQDIESDVSRNEEGEVVGNIEVPADAVEYDSAAKAWVEVGEDKTAYTRGVYEFRFSNYHHGIPMSLVDYLYGEAFQEEWINKDSEDDPYYDDGYSSYLGGMDVGVGTVYDFENERIINYFDYHFPADENRVAGRGAPGWSVSANPNIGISWEITEALARIVVNGGDSGERYAFSGVEGTVQVDVIRPSCVKDIVAELEAMIEEKHVPVSIEDYITEEEAVERYQAALDFIEEYDHAYISNGPFYLSDIDFDANFIELSAFRDESYPFEPGYWKEKLKVTRLSVENMELPSMVAAGEDIEVDVFVDSIVYPDSEGELAEEGNVKILFITDDQEYEFEAAPTIPGVFLGKVPGNITEDLEAGSYTVMAIATAEGAMPSTRTTNIVVY